MREFQDKKNVLWDFDGVILDSMDIRTLGFKQVLKDYPKEQVDQLIKFHKDNGGLSRYVKFDYLFKEIRREKDYDELVQEMAAQYSEIMLKNIASKERLIKEVLKFIEENHHLYNMHIVSGSDEDELRHLCKKLELTKFFISIKGSPTPKIQLVADLLRNYNYQKQETCLIGDSVNDLEAALENGIEFLGYNNILLKQKTDNYIEKFR